MPFRKSDTEYFKAVNITGGSGSAAPRGHSSFADDKAPRDLIPQMQVGSIVVKLVGLFCSGISVLLFL